MSRSPLEQRMALADKTLDDLSHLLSHDMRSPLMVINGLGQIMAERYGAALGDRGLHQLSLMRESGGHLSAQIDQMLVLLRVTRAPLRIATVDLSALCRDIVTQLQPSAPEAQVEIGQVQIEQGLQCQGDADMLRQALHQLLDNAFKFSAGRTPLRITVGRRAEPGHADPVYFVADQGAGFDMADASRLFQPFHRLHTEREFPGLGMGLAIAERIVARHGGRMWAQSQEGVGSTFMFTLDPAP